LVLLLPVLQTVLDFFLNLLQIVLDLLLAGVRDLCQQVSARLPLAWVGVEQQLKNMLVASWFGCYRLGGLSRLLG